MLIKSKIKNYLTCDFETRCNDYSVWCPGDLNYTIDNFLFHFLWEKAKSKKLFCDAMRLAVSENGKTLANSKKSIQIEAIYCEL